MIFATPRSCFLNARARANIRPVSGCRMSTLLPVMSRHMKFSCSGIKRGLLGELLQRRRVPHEHGYSTTLEDLNALLVGRASGFSPLQWGPRSPLPSAKTWGQAVRPGPTEIWSMNSSKPYLHMQQLHHQPGVCWHSSWSQHVSGEKRNRRKALH